MNTITKDTTKEELLGHYKNYPKTGGDNLLEEKPFYENRLMPLLYETPMKSKVLDVGCNDGSFMKMLEDKRKCKTYGVDISETALALAKEKGLKVQFADAHKLPFEDKTFDVVILSEVISHVQNPGEVVAEIKRVLKKNGILLGSCPHKNIQTIAWEDKRMIRRYYNEDELSQVLGKSFDRAWIRTLNGAQFSFSMAQSLLAQEPAEMLFKCGHVGTLGWDAELQDKSVLRCWMGFTQGPGDVYYRMSGYADKMQKLGAQVHYDPYVESDMDSPSAWTRKIRYISDGEGGARFTNAHIVHELETLLKAADMSVFQITSSRDILLLLTTARKGVIKKPMYMEADDWIFDLPSYNLASGAYTPNSDVEAVAYDQVKLSDGFIVSTNYLKKKFEQLAPGKPVYVVKNSLDFDIWDNLQKEKPLHVANPDLIRIIYSGCGNHNGDMELIVEPLRALLDEFPNLEFVSLPYTCLETIKNPRCKIFNTWVPMSVFPHAVNSWEGDIGIAPLRDNELNRAKSNLRWLEYSALHIPTIASDVQPFKESIKNNKDGILVGNSEVEWYDAMKNLILSKENRIKIGDSSYREVKKNYNMTSVAKYYLSVLKHIKNEFVREKERI